MKKGLLFVFLFFLFLAAFVFAYNHVSVRITGFTIAMPNLQCPAYDTESARIQCESAGGTFSTETDESGCQQSSCANFNQENFQGGANFQNQILNTQNSQQQTTCPSINKEEIMRSCKAEGKKFSLEVIEECEYPICSSSECPGADVLGGEKKACEAAGMGAYFVYDINNCPTVECRSSDDSGNIPDFAKKTTGKMMKGFSMNFPQVQCPSEEMFGGMETACIANGGKFFTKEFNGCKLPNCEFTAEAQIQTPFFSCPAINKMEIADKCKTIGLPVKISVEGGCEIPVCGKPEESQCPQISEEKMKTCEAGGMKIIPFVLPNGCKAFKCTAEDQFQSECMKEIPTKWSEKCKLDGGEIYSKADDNGCIINAQCTAKETIEFEEITPEDVSTSEALEIALKLEDVEIKFSEAAEKCASLEKYYQSKGNEDKSRIFNKCSAIFNSAGTQIGAIREILKQDPLTKESLTEAKVKVKELKNVLKQVLHLLLNQDRPFEEIKVFKEGNCGSDMSCFDNCLKSCSECTFTPEGGVQASVFGLENGKCLMVAEAVTEEAKQMYGEFMKCRMTNFAAGFSGKKFDECTGPMAEKMREMQQNMQEFRGGPPQ